MRCQAARFHAHTATHLTKKQGMHHSMAWFESQMPNLAAVVAWAGHSVRNPATVGLEDSILVKHGESEFLPITGRIRGHNGCYGWFDENGYCRRSGKAQREGGIGARDDDHLTATSKMGKSTSLAYEVFPGENSGKEGEAHFEDLDRVVLMGHDSSSPDAVRRLTSDGAIFDWPESVVERTSKVNFAGAKTTEEKQLHFVACALELFYDLMIGSERRVSESPGFETPLGMHVKRRTEAVEDGS